MAEEPEEAVVFQSPNPTEFRMAQNVLEGEGIPCRAIGGSASALLGAVLGSQFAGYQELRVSLELEERALHLLRLAHMAPDSEEPK